MPDVGLLSASNPVAPDTKIVIRFSIEVGGLPVYNESYDVDTLADEFHADETKVVEAWNRRLLCTIASRSKPGFSAALTRCLTDGCCCDCGHEECHSIDVDGDGNGSSELAHEREHVHALEEAMTATEEKSPKVENL